MNTISKLCLKLPPYIISWKTFWVNCNNVHWTIHSTVSVDQHVFYPGRSTVTRAVDFTIFVYEIFESKLQVEIMYTDFLKAFDTIDHGSLIYILDRLGMGEPLFSWIKSYPGNQTQFV